MTKALMLTTLVIFAIAILFTVCGHFERKRINSLPIDKISFDDVAPSNMVIRNNIFIEPADKEAQ